MKTLTVCQHSFQKLMSSPCLTKCKALLLVKLMLLLQELQCFSHSLE
jgi:hypothetical protein